MIKSNVLKGVFLVAFGATSYGMLATFVKMAYDEGFTTAEVTTSQFILGIIGILIINAFQKAKHKNLFNVFQNCTLPQIIYARKCTCRSAKRLRSAGNNRNPFFSH